MTMKAEELESIREGFDFEAKTAGGRDGHGQLPGSLWESYSAMANSHGGRILLGAKERSDGSLELRGIPEIDKVERDLWTTLQNPNKVSVNLLTRDDVERVEIDGRSLLLIRVPRATRDERPVHLNGTIERGTFIRFYEGDHRVSDDVARRMLADRRTVGDEQVLPNFVDADFDTATVRVYRQILAARRPEHPFLEHEGVEFLRAIRAWGKDRERGTEGPTLGGLLMFGTESALRDQFPHWQLSYREFDADETKRHIDRVAPDGTWEANVFNFYRRVIPKLHAGVKSPFAMDKSGHRLDESAVHGALREALVNTLVHADYRGRSGVRVLRRPAGFEFINPGLLLVPAEVFWRGGTSEPRNPVLQHLFSIVQLAEREGYGGLVIRRAWQSQHWQNPTLRTSLQTAETHLELRQVSLLSAASVHWLKEHFGRRFEELDELRRLALITAHAEGAITHARLRELTDQHSRDLTLALTDLKSRHMLLSSGAGRGTMYRIDVPLVVPEAQIDLFDPNAGALEHQVSAHARGSTHKPGSSTHSVSSSTHNAGSSAHKTEPHDGAVVSTHRTRCLDSVTTSAYSEKDRRHHAPEAAKLVASVRATRRASPARVSEAIVAFCSEYRTVAQIAEALDRSAKTIRQNYLADLVRGGELQLKHPDQLTHPEQAYLAPNPR